MTNDVPMARIRSLQQRYTVGQNADGQTNEFAESDWLAFRSLLAADPDLIYDPVVTTANAFMLAETLQSDSVAEHCFQHMQHGTYFIYYELKRFPEIPHSTQGLQFIHDEQILFSEIPEWAHEKNRRWGFYGSDGHNNPGMEF